MQQACEVGIVIIIITTPVLQRKLLGSWKVMQLAQSPKPSKEHIWDLNPGSPGLEPMLLTRREVHRCQQVSEFDHQGDGWYDWGIQGGKKRLLFLLMLIRRVECWVKKTSERACSAPLLYVCLELKSQDWRHEAEDHWKS